MIQQPTEPHPLPPTELSIVVPVYRSAPTLRLFTSRLLRVLEPVTPDFEVVFVDDGSPDDAWQVLCELQAEHPNRIVAVQLMRNFGQHNALMCGFRMARGRLIVTMDDDLQNPPEEVPKLVATLLEGNFDLVYGSPKGTKRQAAWRNVGSRVVNAFYRNVFHSSIPISSFRIIRRELMQAIFSYNLNYTFVDGLLAWNTQRIGEVAVEHHPRAAGRSGYSLARLLILTLNLLTNFSLLPLQVVSATGFCAAIFGFLTALVFLFLYLFSSISVPGFASIIISILVMGGIQLMGLGIMGEYIGRLHLNVNRKPQYTVRQLLGGRLPSIDKVSATLSDGREPQVPLECGGRAEVRYE
jgi:undecaprenyl-phosphate 4-deoxy-4-formamido-L-arabinose transferase